ncbi:hypothetical protein [Kribbella antibiotica]|uniref:hypothetical protein n=1 Tax=Kribbella antibiotica TaxID=190195 RepID=UPI0014054DFF|nr:hypothetical protein [Kribbella antibiotica]
MVSTTAPARTWVSPAPAAFSQYLQSVVQLTNTRTAPASRHERLQVVGARR